MSKKPGEKGYWVEGMTLGLGYDQKALEKGQMLAYAAEVDAQQPGLEAFTDVHAITDIQDIGDIELNPKYISIQQERGQEQESLGQENIEAIPEEIRAGQEPIQEGQVKAEPVNTQTIETDRVEKPKEPEFSPKATIFSNTSQQIASTAEIRGPLSAEKLKAQREQRGIDGKDKSGPENDR